MYTEQINKDTVYNVIVSFHVTKKMRSQRNQYLDVIFYSVYKITPLDICNNNHLACIPCSNEICNFGFNICCRNINFIWTLFYSRIWWRLTEDLGYIKHICKSSILQYWYTMELSFYDLLCPPPPPKMVVYLYDGRKNAVDSQVYTNHFWFSLSCIWIT